MEPCKHEDLIEDMKKDLYGNNRKGIKDTVLQLKLQFKFLIGAIIFLNTQLILLFIYILWQYFFKR
jgi:hypothetical protein